MKCNSCGTIFKEGIFCPECGTKVIEDSEKSVNDKNRKLKEENARLKEENLLMEQQKKKWEEEEKEKTKKRLEEAERLIQENAKKDLENHTVRGTVYKTEEEAMQAKAEHDSIDILKMKLMSVKSQEKRQEVFSEFNKELHFLDTKRRYELLKIKVEMPKPKSEKALVVYGISILIALIGFIVLDTCNISSGFWEVIWFVCAIWYGFGFWIWIIWRVVLLRKQKKNTYYRNIGDI